MWIVEILLQLFPKTDNNVNKARLKTKSFLIISSLFIGNLSQISLNILLK